MESDKMKRWKFLDSLLASGESLSVIDILEKLHTNNDTCQWKWQLEKIRKLDYAGQMEWYKKHHYLSNFRKDIDTFKKALKNAGIPEMLVVGRGAKDKELKDGKDNRTKTYRYAEKGFSIIPLLADTMSSAEYRMLYSSVEKLKNTMSEQTFQEVSFAILSRVDADYGKGINCVDYEDNRRLKGRQYRPIIFDAIRKRQILEIRYKTFDGTDYTFEIHPYLLKQYNERWFLFCYNPIEGNKYFILPLDRIASMPMVKGTFSEKIPENYKDFFKDIIGVTKESGVQVKKILVGVHDINAWGRITTKPLNTMQVEKDFNKEENYGQVSLTVAPNTEMYMKILSLGENIDIETEPERSEMKKIISGISRQYN